MSRISFFLIAILFSLSCTQKQEKNDIPIIYVKVTDVCFNWDDIAK